MKSAQLAPDTTPFVSARKDDRATPRSEGVTHERFREVMRQLPTSVVVITADSPEGPVALAVGSFVSVSLEPLLVGFFPAKTSTSWPLMRGAGRFCVNVLAEDQVALSRTFAARGGDKFSSVRWHPGRGGSPALEGCVMRLDCDLHSEIDVGDHHFVLGMVSTVDLVRDAHALVFHRGDYTSTAAASFAEGDG